MQQQEKMPKVSVCVITYNHEKYIRQCLQSIVDQKTDFDFEVIVGEDCSTDRTRGIVQEFAQRYPGVVTTIVQEKNAGGMENYLTVHRAAHGEYVCHVDGDDWICPNKLTSQVSYLNAHSECTLVAHRVAVWDNEKQVGVTRRNSELISLSELLRHHPMFVHSSIMYRRDRLRDVFAPNSTFIDFYIYVSAVLQGKIGFINEILGNYRRNIGVSCKRELMPYIQAAIDLAANNIGELPDVLHCRSRQHLSYAVAALLAGDSHDFNSQLALAKRFVDKKLLINILCKFKDWPRSLRAVVLLYKRANLWMQQSHDALFVVLTECKVRVRKHWKLT